MRIVNSIRLLIISLLVIATLYISASVSVYGATGINQVINFQGKVVNTDGTNVTDGTYDFTVKLYDGAASGSSNTYTETWSSAALWSSTMSSAPTSGGESLTYSSNTNETTIKVGQLIWNTTKGEAVTVTSVNTGTNVMGISPTRQAWANSDTITNKIYVKDGVFKIAINSLNQDLSAVDFNSDTIFMGVNFNADGEMKPRIRFTATPYAFNAQKVNGLTVTATTGTLTIPNSTTIAFSGTNNATFTTTGTTALTLPTAGTLATLAGTETFTSKTIGSTGLTFSGATTDITTGTNEDFVINPNGTGKVGIGTTSPLSLLNIAGAVKGKALVALNETGDQALFTASASGTTKFLIDHAGNIGIGTTNTSAYRLSLGSNLTNQGILEILASDLSQVFNVNTTNNYANVNFGDNNELKQRTSFVLDDNTKNIFFNSEGRILFGDNNGNDTGSNFKMDVANSQFSFNSASVGIGTTAPIEILDIRGNASVSGNLTLSGGVRTIAGRSMNDLIFGDSQTGNLNLQPKGTSATGNVQIGAGGAGSTTPDYFALDVKSTTGDPSGGFEGAMYYNTFDNKFRCYQGSAWTDCIGTGGAGPWTDGTGISYLTDTAEDFAVGGSTLAAPFSVDVSANTARIGSGSSTNGVLSMYASDGDTGNITYTTNDGWAFEGGNLGIGTTNASYKLDIVSSDTTGLLQLAGNSITTGTGINLVTNALSSGNAMSISSTSTALTTGNLVTLDWSPGSATTATGDILGINIGSNGTIGNLINLKNNGTSIFSVSQTQIVNGLPTAFNAPGDVSIAYDLTFTNQTASYIKSSAPLYLETGESFESNDMTLRTFNSGNVIVDLAGSGGLSIGSSVSPVGKFHVEGAKTGKALAIFNETGNQDIFTASASGSTVFSLARTGSITFNQASTVQTSTGNLSFVTAGTATANVQIGTGGAGTATPDYFALDVKSNTGDPSGGFEGAMYYNTFDNKFRCYQGSAWADCIGSGGSLTVRESDGTPSVTTSTIEFGPASSSSDEFVVTDQTGGVTRVILGTTVAKADNSLVFTNKSIGSTGLTYAGASTDITTGTNEDFTISPNGSGKVVLGTTTNGFSFDPSAGPTYTGTARPAKSIKLSPEYIGASLTASGSATTNGTMTSDTIHDTTAGWENYYEWTSTQGSLQDYTIAVKVMLPSDFSAWASSNAVQINYATENTATAKNKLDVSIYNMTTNPDKVVYQTLTNASGTNGVWTTATVDDSQLVDSTSPDWSTAGETAVIFIKPYSLVDAVNCTGGVDNGCYVRIGDIVLNYVAKF